MSRATKDEIAAATEKRLAIIDQFLEVFTGDAISTKELQRLRYVSEIFAIAPVITELCSTASTIEGRSELALSAAVCALNIALDDSPPPEPKRKAERREARAAAKQFEQRVAGKSDADGGACVAEPDKPVKPPSIHNRPRAELSPDELERVRKASRERQARWRARVRAAKGR